MSPTKTEIEPAALCSWWGMYSGTGGTCQVCGSPMTGGHLLDAPPPAPRRKRKSRVVRASDVKRLLEAPPSEDDRVPCPWCGLMSAAGSMCDQCGSPMTGGNAFTLPDEPGAEIVRSVSKGSPRTRPEPQPPPPPRRQPTPLPEPTVQAKTAGPEKPRP